MLPTCSLSPKVVCRPACRSPLLADACSLQQYTNKFDLAGFRFARTHTRIAIDAPSLNARLIMSAHIFVGNLPFSVTDTSLRSNFGEFGKVTSAKVMMDRDTNKSEGFGFD